MSDASVDPSLLVYIRRICQQTFLKNVVNLCHGIKSKNQKDKNSLDVPSRFFDCCTRVALTRYTTHRFIVLNYTVTDFSEH